MAKVYFRPTDCDYTVEAKVKIFYSPFRMMVERREPFPDTAIIVWDAEANEYVED